MRMVEGLAYWIVGAHCERAESRRQRRVIRRRARATVRFRVAPAAR